MRVCIISVYNECRKMNKVAVFLLLGCVLFFGSSNNAFGMKLFFQKFRNLFQKKQVLVRQGYPVFITKFCNGTTQLWNIKTGKCFKAFQRNVPDVRENCIEDDKEFERFMIGLDFVNSSEQLRSVTNSFTNKRDNQQFYDDFGYLTIYSSGPRIEMREFQTEDCIASLKECNGDIKDCLFSPSGEFLAILRAYPKIPVIRES